VYPAGGGLESRHVQRDPRKELEEEAKECKPGKAELGVLRRQVTEDDEKQLRCEQCILFKSLAMYMARHSEGKRLMVPGA
jgi:hypothetical protein